MGHDKRGRNAVYIDVDLLGTSGRTGSKDSNVDAENR